MCSINCFFTFIEIISHIILYASIVLYALILTTDIKILSSTLMCIIMVVVYLFYVICEFISPTFNFLKNKISPDKLKDIFDLLIKTSPQIEVFKEKNENKYEQLVYKSSRDVSGYIDLDVSKEELKGKSFIALEIIPEIYLSDEISFLDYVIFKGKFSKKYVGFGGTKEKRYIIEDFNNYILINIGNKTPCSVNYIFYIIFTIIPIVLFYKLYINSFFYEKQIKIIKLISTREDLNQEKYQIYNPYIKCFGQIYDYENSNFIHVRTMLITTRTTENDIKFSLKYKDCTPKFEIEKYVDIDEHRKIGIIKGIQSSYFNNEIDDLDAYIFYGEYLNSIKDNINANYIGNNIIIRNNLNSQNNNTNDIEDGKTNNSNNIMLKSEENRINVYAIKSEES